LRLDRANLFAMINSYFMLSCAVKSSKRESQKRKRRDAYVVRSCTARNRCKWRRWITRLCVNLPASSRTKTRCYGAEERWKAGRLLFDKE